MPAEDLSQDCQVIHIQEASTLMPRHIARVYRFNGFLQKHGFRATFRKIYGRLFAKNPPVKSRASPQSDSPELTLNLQPGEWVEVKPYDAIRRTLDAEQRHRGMLFMPGMAQHCGRRFQVHKLVTRILMEATGEVRRMRNTVLLADSTCDGLSIGCDRSCFYFWREAWLQRVPQAGSEHPSGEARNR